MKDTITTHEHFDEQTLHTWLNENAEAYSKFKKDFEEALREPFWTTLCALDESDVETIEPKSVIREHPYHFLMTVIRKMPLYFAVL